MSMCPQTFSLAVHGTGWQCEPTEEYTGPCGQVDFEGYNWNMLQSWSQACDAWWPCLGIAADNIQEELSAKLFPLTQKATARRIAA